MPDITIESLAHGGEGVGRINGKAHFIPGVMPGELAEIEVVRDKARWARGRLVRVVAPSPDRVEPPCPAFATCGGCTWQYAAYKRQLEWKRDIVAGQLAHLGGLGEVPVRETIAPGDPFAYRNRMDFSVVRGRPALHERASNRLVALHGCPLLCAELAERFSRLGDLSGAHKLVLRAGVNTGEALIMIEGRIPDQAGGWDASVVALAGGRLHTVKGRPWLEEEVDGVRFQIPADAFFQVNTAGAGVLVDLVAGAAAVTTDDVLLDGYAGVGLFAATVGRSAGRVVTIDSGEAAYRAIAKNLQGSIPGSFRSLLGSFEEIASTAPDRWDVAVVDPPRAGLGADGVAAVSSPAPRTIVLISCDPASLARDARMLADVGYEAHWVQPVDLFPQTYHIETVTRFRQK